MISTAERATRDPASTNPHGVANSKPAIGSDQNSRGNRRVQPRNPALAMKPRETRNRRASRRFLAALLTAYPRAVAAAAALKTSQK